MGCRPWITIIHDLIDLQIRTAASGVGLPMAAVVRDPVKPFIASPRRSRSPPSYDAAVGGRTVPSSAANRDHPDLAIRFDRTSAGESDPFRIVLTDDDYSGISTEVPSASAMDGLGTYHLPPRPST